MLQRVCSSNLKSNAKDRKIFETAVTDRAVRAHLARFSFSPLMRQAVTWELPRKSTVENRNSPAACFIV